EQAEAQLRTGIARSGSQPFYRREYLNAGFKAEVAEMDGLRAMGADPAGGVSDELSDALGKVGSRAEVHRFVQRFRDGGDNLPVIRPVYEPDTERTLTESIGD